MLLSSSCLLSSLTSLCSGTKMKPTLIAILCLPLLVIHIKPSLASKSGKFPQIMNAFKKPSKTKPNLDTKSKTQQSTQFNQGGYPQQPSYPQQPGYPGHQAGAYPAPVYPYRGSYDSYGGYPGGYINHNPNNKILSPHYASSFGYGGYGAGGGSPFSNYAKTQGFVPSDKSKGFGRRAALAAAGGALTGMALGYGLGRFPRPHFHFHSPQEEYYYNYYMYRKYGIISTDTNDFSRDYEYIQVDVTFDSFIKSCMNRADLLPVKNQKPNLKPAVTTSKPPTAATVNSTIASITAALGTASTPHPPNKYVDNPAPAASQLLQTDDDDTVSIVEIGYPALITQVKLKRCIELYIVNAERNLKKKTKLESSSGAQRLQTDLRGLFSVITSIIVILQTQLH
uniref:Prion protein, related sequence 3 n=1 Tax=Neolamprologus brichardi TaxID=32507 RepID=A0A3Q4HSY6_NEOBR